jgi:polyferredoxin
VLEFSQAAIYALKLGSKRKLIQIAAFVVSNLGFIGIFKTGFVCPFLYCHGCPFAAFGCPVGIIQNFIIYQQFPLFTIGSLGIYGVIFGRVFCGWACPFGTMHDLLSYSNKKRSIQTRNHWYIKYIILFLTLALAWFALDSVFCKYCPSGSLFAAIPFRLLYPEAAEFGLFFYTHMFTLVLTILLAILISRFWCRYLCPLGAIAGVFNKVSMLTIDWDKEKCKMCKDCLEACKMGIREMKDISHSTDCTLCGNCVEACSEKALFFTIKGRQKVH